MELLGIVNKASEIVGRGDTEQKQQDASVPSAPIVSPRPGVRVGRVLLWCQGFFLSYGLCFKTGGNLVLLLL